MIWHVYAQSIEAKHPEPIGDYEIPDHLGPEEAIGLARIEHQIPGCVCVGATRGEIPEEHRPTRLHDPTVHQNPMEICRRMRSAQFAKMKYAKRQQLRARAGL